MLFTKEATSSKKKRHFAKVGEIGSSLVFRGAISKIVTHYLEFVCHDQSPFKAEITQYIANDSSLSISLGKPLCHRALKTRKSGIWNEKSGR